MPRAVETATLVKNVIKFKSKMKMDASLCECVPSFPIKLKRIVHLKSILKTQKQIELICWFVMVILFVI